jgi:predicted membrane protein
VEIGTNIKRFDWSIIIAILYFGGSVFCWVYDHVLISMILGIPWSMPLMMLSGLVLHMTVDGEKFLATGSLIGTILNIGIYHILRRRRPTDRFIQMAQHAMPE